MNPLQFTQLANRRTFLQNGGIGLGAAALSTLLPQGAAQAAPAVGGLPGLPHFPPTAKRVIYMFQSGAPSQFETFDYKPQLVPLRKTDLPDSVRMGQRLTGMTSGQKAFPVAPSIFKFNQHGECGTWISELLPHTARIVDDIAVVRSVHTEAINHDPAITFIQTGSQIAGRPSMGAWVAYGLGTMNRDLPTFVTLISRPVGGTGGQPLYDRLWGSGFLPSRYQGVKLRSGNEPVLYLKTPEGYSQNTRRRMLDDIAALNRIAFERTSDPEVLTRIEQYELAFRMQAAVPELTDIHGEPQHVLEKYGPDVERPGSYARNCLLARRLVERDVRFVQLYHMGWDHHGDLPERIAKQCVATDQPAAALLEDLKERDLLKDTLIIWGGEFGRTVYSQGTLSETNYGRDHHPRCFSVWLAGGGVKGGAVHGETDDFSYNITADPVHVHDLNATVLHCLGIDHKRLTVKNQGLDMRLTGVEEHHPVTAILA
ncbi:MAG: DUF1501 domain-containing protein [Planctomycetaceae bacterium]